MASFAGDGDNTSASSKPSKEEIKASVVNEAKAMNNMDGKEKDDDVILHGVDISVALAKLVEMIEAAEGNRERWNFRGLHLGHEAAAGKDIHDVHRSFLRW